jgi:hypothetical protein
MHYEIEASIPKGTLSVKFGIYVHQMTIFKGVLNDFPTHFYHLIIIILIYKY